METRSKRYYRIRRFRARRRCTYSTTRIESFRFLSLPISIVKYLLNYLLNSKAVKIFLIFVQIRYRSINNQEILINWRKKDTDIIRLLHLNKTQLMKNPRGCDIYQILLYS